MKPNPEKPGLPDMFLRLFEKLSSDHWSGCLLHRYKQTGKICDTVMVKGDEFILFAYLPHKYYHSNL